MRLAEGIARLLRDRLPWPPSTDTADQLAALIVAMLKDWPAARLLNELGYSSDERDGTLRVWRL